MHKKEKKKTTSSVKRRNQSHLWSLLETREALKVIREEKF